MKKKELIQINNFEVAEEKDYLLITYILASSIPNGNGALFTKEELEKSKDTILDQPLIIVPDWDGKPTGHSIEDFPKVGWDAHIIGVHIGSEIVEEDEVTHLKTQVKVWKTRYPEIASTMMNLHSVGDLKFSMECSFTSQTIEGSIRELHGVNFIGSAVVDDPANPYSYSLEAATKKLKGGNVVNLEQALNKITELQDQISGIKNEKANLETEKTQLESNKSELAESLESANNKIDEVTTELNNLKSEVAEKEKQELASKRFDEMSKYVEYKDEEKEGKMTAFASMDDTTFELLVETAKRNKKEEKQETASTSSDTKVDLAANKNRLSFLDAE